MTTETSPLDVKRHTFTSRQLSLMTFDSVDNWYRQGCVTQDEFEAYMHVWATWPAHEGYSNGRGWTDESSFPEVRAIGVEIRKALEERES